MSVNLVTGYAGKPHVTSADQALFNAGVCGSGKYVMHTGERFAYTINSSNSISIASGDLVNQGRHINIPINTNVDVDIETGKSGYHRIDLIAMRYSKDANTSIESAELIVVKGNSVVLNENAAVPDVISGNLFEGDNIDDFPLYQVHINELTIDGVYSVFSYIPSISSMWETLYPIGSIYISANHVSPADIFGGKWKQITDCFLFASGTKDVGITGGEYNVTLSEENLPSHKHVVERHSHSISQHNHTAKCASAGKHSHGTYYRTDNSSGGSSQRIGSSSANAGTHQTTADGSHTHTVTIDKGGPTATDESSPNTSFVGKNEPFSIMPPFLTVYMWQRIS